jgi:hypothetical protein
LRLPLFDRKSTPGAMKKTNVMSATADLGSISASLQTSATPAYPNLESKEACDRSGCDTPLRASARGLTVRSRCKLKGHNGCSGTAVLKGVSAALTFPCRRHLSTGVASSQVTSERVSSRGRIIRQKVNFSSVIEHQDGIAVLQPEGSRVENAQTCLRKRLRSASFLERDAAPTRSQESVYCAVVDRSAIAPQLRADMLQFLQENPDLRPKSRRTWEWFKRKTCCERSADSLKTHASSKTFRMEQGGRKASLKRPQRLKIKKDMWKR